MMSGHKLHTILDHLLSIARARNNNLPEAFSGSTFLRDWSLITGRGRATKREGWGDGSI